MRDCTKKIHSLFIVVLVASSTAPVAATSADIEVGGRLQLDLAIYDEDVATLNDGTEFRRARVFVEGELLEDWSFKAQYDFAENSITMQDAYIRYTGLPAGTLTIGQFKQPFGLEEMTSSRYITFMERALPNAFAIGRRVGIGYANFGDRFGIQASVFGQSAGAGDNGDEGFGVGARVTFAPLRTDDRLVHFGIAISTESPEDDIASAVRFRERPESHVSDVRLVDTGTITNVDSIGRLGLEAAAVFGPFSLQSEYIAASISRGSGFEDFDLDGYYVYGSWFLTGESRPYSNGAFGRVSPAAESGAWELALRLSELNLNDGSLAGGKERNISLGVNYYLSRNLRFMGNYVIVDTDASAGDDDPSILQFRVAMDF
jgi:phosphate-selective porin OprO and OprP